jgi:murein L,D-transpeptidase YcbB/YkuD
VETGSDSITVCASGGSCNAVLVTVTAPGTASVSATGVSGGTLAEEVQSLQNVVAQMLTQLQSLETQLSTIASQVANGTSTTVPSSSGTTLSAGAAGYQFENFLSEGSEGADVTALQDRLIADGYLTAGNATGYFGPLTAQAVASYQKAYGISPVGYVGPGTRAELNAGK